MKDQDLEKINSLLTSAESQIVAARELLFGKQITIKAKALTKSSGDRVVEGIFDGLSMVDSAGNEYPVPANYASKSKLIPGDVLKLTITDDGSFIFKQIGPIARKKIIGLLEGDESQYFASANGNKYKVLLASVTFFKVQVGDKLTIIIPADQPSEYAAIENIIRGL